MNESALTSGEKVVRGSALAALLSLALVLVALGLFLFRPNAADDALATDLAEELSAMRGSP